MSSNFAAVEMRRGESDGEMRSLLYHQLPRRRFPKWVQFAFRYHTLGCLYYKGTVKNPPVYSKYVRFLLLAYFMLMTLFINFVFGELLWNEEQLCSALEFCEDNCEDEFGEEACYGHDEDLWFSQIQRRSALDGRIYRYNETNSEAWKKCASKYTAPLEPPSKAGNQCPGYGIWACFKVCETKNATYDCLVGFPMCEGDTGNNDLYCFHSVQCFSNTAGREVVKIVVVGVLLLILSLLGKAVITCCCFTQYIAANDSRESTYSSCKKMGYRSLACILSFVFALFVMFEAVFAFQPRSMIQSNFGWTFLQCIATFCLGQLFEFVTLVLIFVVGRRCDCIKER